MARLTKGWGWLAVLLGVGLFLGAAPAGAQLVRKTLVYGGATRTWFEHLPASYDGSQNVPLVLVLHGVQSTGDQFAPKSEWTPVSDQQGFIVVYPNGGLDFGSNGLGWNDFQYNGEKPDDVGFLVQLIQKLKNTYRIDPDRVYMTGFSNGASMTNTFAGLHASVLAAMAPCSSDWMTTYGVPESVQHPDGTVSSWISRGSLENFQEGTQSHDEQDANQTAYWVGIDGCNPTPQTVTDGIYTTQVYTGGQGEVRYSKVDGYSHQYGPGFAQKIWDDFFSRIVRGTVPDPVTLPAPTPDPVPEPTPPSTEPEPGLPVVTVTASRPNASALTGRAGAFRLWRAGDVSADVKVRYRLSGTAVNGEDYSTPLARWRTLWATRPFERVFIYPAPPLDGATGPRTVHLKLLPGVGYTVGEPSEAQVLIHEQR